MMVFGWGYYAHPDNPNLSFLKSMFIKTDTAGNETSYYILENSSIDSTVTDNYDSLCPDLPIASDTIYVTGYDVITGTPEFPSPQAYYKAINSHLLLMMMYPRNLVLLRIDNHTTAVNGKYIAESQTKIRDYNNTEPVSLLSTKKQDEFLRLSAMVRAAVGFKTFGV